MRGRARETQGRKLGGRVAGSSDPNTSEEEKPDLCLPSAGKGAYLGLGEAARLVRTLVAEERGARVPARRCVREGRAAPGGGDGREAEELAVQHAEPEGARLLGGGSDWRREAATASEEAAKAGRGGGGRGSG